MNIIDSIKRFLFVQESKTNQITITHRMQTIGNPEVYAEVNAQRAINRGYMGNSDVFSIVSKSAKKFASIPRYVYNLDGEKETVKGQELAHLLNRPNAYFGQDSFLHSLSSYYIITGESFIWLNRGDTIDANGQPKPDEVVDRMPVLEMFVLPSEHMLLKPDPNNLWAVEYYLLEVGGQKIRFNKNDIIHWKTVNMNFDPFTRSHMRGLSPLTPGYKTLQQNEDAVNATVRMYQNDGAKGIIFNPEMNEMTPEQQTQLRNVIDARINNNTVKGAIATLQGDWKHINLGISAVDMQLLEGKMQSMKELCALFDIPYELFQSDTTFANKEMALKGWVSNTIIPLSRQLDDELNRVLLKAFALEGMCYIACDYSGLPEMQKDLGTMVTTLVPAWWITPNEKREMMNEEAIPNPLFDEPWIPTGLTPLSQLDEPQMQELTQQLIKQGLIPSNKPNDGDT